MKSPIQSGSFFAEISGHKLLGVFLWVEAQLAGDQVLGSGVVAARRDGQLGHLNWSAVSWQYDSTTLDVSFIDSSTFYLRCGTFDKTVFTKLSDWIVKCSLL